MPEPFIFGVPLIARASSADWARVEALLSLTLASVAQQSDGAYRIVVAGHDRPSELLTNPRIAFLESDWPAEAVRADNLDSGRKKNAICEHVLATGGGLLMFLDADDWVHTRLVETARAAIGARDVGGFIDKGLAADIHHLRVAPIPHLAVFDGGFHRICGSSTVARLNPDETDPVRRNPHAALHEHFRWPEVAAEQGVSVVRLPVPGTYVINTAANHSETHGPFAAWRRDFCDAVCREGAPLDDAALAEFGLQLAQVTSAFARTGSNGCESQFGAGQPDLDRVT